MSVYARKEGSFICILFSFLFPSMICFVYVMNPNILNVFKSFLFSNNSMYFIAVNVLEQLLEASVIFWKSVGAFITLNITKPVDQQWITVTLISS